MSFPRMTESQRIARANARRHEKHYRERTRVLTPTEIDALLTTDDARLRAIVTVVHREIRRRGRLAKSA